MLKWKVIFTLTTTQNIYLIYYIIHTIQPPLPFRVIISNHPLKFCGCLCFLLNTKLCSPPLNKTSQLRSLVFTSHKKWHWENKANKYISHWLNQQHNITFPTYLPPYHYLCIMTYRTTTKNQLQILSNGLCMCKKTNT